MRKFLFVFIDGKEHQRYEFLDNESLELAREEFEEKFSKEVTFDKYRVYELVEVLG